MQQRSALVTLPRVVVLALLALALLGGALAAQSAREPLGTSPTLVDLSEGGEALELELLRGGSRPLVRVGFGPSAPREVLDLEVRNAVPGRTLEFRVEGAPRPLAPEVSQGEFRWRPARLVPGGFEVDAPASRFVVRLAPLLDAGGAADAPYYSWTRFRGYMEEILQEPGAQSTQIGTSLQGRPLFRIRIDPPSPYAKKTVVMAVRQHGNEDGSSYVLEGALDLLLGRDGRTPEPELLQRIRWIVYPLCNPDGAVANARGNANGFDLNREWDRSGCSASQQREIELIQCDLEAVQEQFGIDIVGDHHGWANGVHGGYRYALGQSVSNVGASEYQEAKKDTLVIERHDPTQTGWEENGGVLGMLRAEMFRRYGFLVHTPEYDDLLSSEMQFRAKGRAWVRAMYDTLFAPRFVDAEGETLSLATLPGLPLFLEVDDLDENQDPALAETVVVLLADSITGDAETLELLETGEDTGLFRAPVPVVPASGAASPGDGRLESVTGSRVLASYTDDDRAANTSRTSVLVLLEPGRAPGGRRP